jgi:hypothetical protein
VACNSSGSSTDWITFGGRGGIFRKPFAGGAEIQITHHGGANSQESWDGKTVYYFKSGGLWQVPAEGGEERPLGINPGYRAEC